MYPFSTQLFELQIGQLFKLNKNSRVYVCTGTDNGISYRVAENLKAKSSKVRSYHTKYHKKVTVVQFY